MGTDFPEKAAKTFKKSWDRGACDLGMENLFSRLVVEESRSFTARINEAHFFNQGDQVTVEVRGKKIVLTLGLATVAVCENAPSDTLIALAENCGISPGRVTANFPISGMVEITLCQ